jgi:hypothetical protein
MTDLKNDATVKDVPASSMPSTTQASLPTPNPVPPVLNPATPSIQGSPGVPSTPPPLARPPLAKQPPAGTPQPAVPAATPGRDWSVGGRPLSVEDRLTSMEAALAGVIGQLLAGARTSEAKYYPQAKSAAQHALDWFRTVEQKYFPVRTVPTGATEGVNQANVTQAAK